MKKLGIGAAIGAAGMWLLDPFAGRRRRALVRDRGLGLLRRGIRGGTPKDLNDQTLKSKVESELFREQDAPKGQVDVNAQAGVVQLRGEVDSTELIEELVQRARGVQGVRDVENLLHLPGTPAPMHQ